MLRLLPATATSKMARAWRGSPRRMKSKWADVPKRRSGGGIGPGERSEQSRLSRVAATRLPPMFGVFDVIGFERTNVGKGQTERALLLMLGDLRNQAPLL